MMVYKLRKNFSANYYESNRIMRGKIAFKTKELEWVETTSSVIILISVHSAFHDGRGGDLKMNALISTIKGNVRGKISVLLADAAHIQVDRLKDPLGGLNHSIRAAKQLAIRYQEYFEGCELLYWHDAIWNDPDYPLFKRKIAHLFQKDRVFQQLLFSDGASLYTLKGKESYKERDLFIQKSVDDILEQCVCALVLENRGYGYQFYPGPPYESVKYVSRGLTLRWIHVFLAIERKTEVVPNIKGENL